MEKLHENESKPTLEEAMVGVHEVKEGEVGRGREIGKAVFILFDFGTHNDWDKLNGLDHSCLD